MHFLSQDIIIIKDGGPLGLSIVGGADHTSHPFGIEESGIFISKVQATKIFSRVLVLLEAASSIYLITIKGHVKRCSKLSSVPSMIIVCTDAPV